MAESLFTQWRLSAENISANSTVYLGAAAGSIESDTQASSDRPLRRAGTASNLRVKIENNGVTAASTFTLQDSQVDTNLVVAIAASTSGDLEDSSNTADLIASDEILFELTAGATGTSLDIAFCSMAIDWDTDVTTLLGINSAGSSSWGANETEYFPVFGGRNSIVTEGEREYRIGGANVTWQDMSLFTGNVTRSDNSTVVSRVNGADGNMSITITPTDVITTLEDSANNDVLSENDDFCWEVTTGGGTGILNLEKAYGNLVSADKEFFISSHGNPDRVSDNLTRFSPLCGELGEEATESRTNTRAPFDYTSKNLIAHIKRMTGSVLFAGVFRIDGADGNQVVNLTGVSIVQDSANSDDVTAGDIINLKYSSPNQGVNFDLQYFGTVGEIAAAGSTFEETIAVEVQPSISETPLTTFEPSLTITLQTALSASPDSVLEPSVTVSLQPSVFIAPDTVLETGITVSADLDIQGLASAAFEDQVALAVSQAVASAEDVSFEELVSLDLVTALAAAADTTFEPAVSLAVQAALATAPDSTLEAAVSMAVQAALQASPELTIEESIALAKQVAVNVLAGSTLEGQITLAISDAISAIPGTAFEVAVSLDLVKALTAAADTTLEASIAVAVQSAIAAAPTISFAPAIALAVQPAVDATATLVLEPSISLPMTVSVLSPLGTMTFEGQASMALTPDLEAAGGIDLEGTVSLALQPGIASESEIAAAVTIEALVSLTTTLGMTIASALEAVVPQGFVTKRPRKGYTSKRPDVTKDSQEL